MKNYLLIFIFMFLFVVGCIVDFNLKNSEKVKDLKVNVETTEEGDIESLGVELETKEEKSDDQ